MLNLAAGSILPDIISPPFLSHCPYPECVAAMIENHRLQPWELRAIGCAQSRQLCALGHTHCPIISSGASPQAASTLKDGLLKDGVFLISYLVVAVMKYHHPEQLAGEAWQLGHKAGGENWKSNESTSIRAHAR